MVASLFNGNRTLSCFISVTVFNDLALLEASRLLKVKAESGLLGSPLTSQELSLEDSSGGIKKEWLRV